MFLLLMHFTSNQLLVFSYLEDFLYSIEILDFFITESQPYQSLLVVVKFDLGEAKFVHNCFDSCDLLSSVEDVTFIASIEPT